MTPVPIELPLSAADAARIAEVLMPAADGRPVRDDVRNRVAAQFPRGRLASLTAYFGSLAADPVHPAAYFLAVDGLLHGDPQPLLLRIASASTPASALFPNPLLIGRMRAGHDREVVVSATPFGPADRDHVLRYAAEVDPSFQPRATGTRAPFAIAAAEPETVLPEAFPALRYLLRTRGWNQAVFRPVDLDPATIHRTETVAVWSAIRAGWREGFSLELEFDTPEAPQSAAGYTAFVAPAAAEPSIAALRKGGFKRFDPDAAVAQRTARLTAILAETPSGEINDAILEFAVT